MSAPPSHKLSSAFEGALAGGGDPATSPLYVFTPFLRLIVVGAAAGVASVTFGASIWLVVLTVFVVSVMYRLVMRWVTDGSGGSGLSEEEFGGWAVKTNAAITYIEYTLTFLVSVAALVTFVADRFPALNQGAFGLGVSWRAILAVALSLLTGWLVNRGPKTAARFFGPATLGVLILLWAMVGSVLWQHLQGWLGGESLLAGSSLLPTLSLQAFSLEATAPGEGSYLSYTIGGYVRILALMTGIEVFANLVAAYEGDAEQKSRRAFGSLLIIMGTTAVTMVIVGPAILALSNPANEEVSVFTQTMDQLLPGPLAYLGTLVGVAVLLSAAAASAEGIQNLSLGLTTRRYIPPFFGRPNRFGVAPVPVWIEVGICCVCFLLVSTTEETYLAVYAAGVFILLSMTGWASTQRLIRETGQRRGRVRAGHVGSLLGSGLAAVLTTLATFVIFRERFFEGAWVFLLLIPILYTAFTYVHGHMGAPTPLEERLGRIAEGSAGGLGPGQREGVPVLPEPVLRQVLPPEPGAPAPAAPALEPIGLGGVRVDLAEREWAAPPAAGEGWRGAAVALDHLLLGLDGSAEAESVLPLALRVTGSGPRDGRITLLSVLPEGSAEATTAARRAYLGELAEELGEGEVQVDVALLEGPIARGILRETEARAADAITMTSHGRAPSSRFLLGSVSRKVVQLADRPVLLLRRGEEAPAGTGAIRRVLVGLDGSAFAERVLPYAMALARAQGAELLLLVVPEIPEAETYGAVSELVLALRRQAEAQAEAYLSGVLGALADEGLEARGLVGGMGAARTIADQARAAEADLIMLATHGRGGLDGLLLGSVAARVVRHADRPVFLLPIHERVTGGTEGGAEGGAEAAS